MNRMKTSLFFVVAATAIAFAIPGGAGPVKTYSLSIDTSQVQYTTTAPIVVQVPAPITVNLKNEAPPSSGANSTIGSFQLTLYGLTVTEVTSCPKSATCSLAGNTITVTNISPGIQATQTYALGLNVSSCGDATIPIATTIVRTGSQLTGNTFAPKTQSVPSGSISCGDSDCQPGINAFIIPDSTNSTTTDPRYVTGLRGEFDKNGACAVVSYYVTNTIPTDNQVHFRWDTSTDDAAVFAYKLNVANDGSSPIRVAWLTNSDGTPAFIDAIQCNTLSVNAPVDLPLPAPYGKLSANLKANDKSFKIDTSQAVVQPPNPLPVNGFPIVIGTERMQVTKITTNTWTVTRGQGGTGAQPHSQNDQVMSTPLPLLAANAPAPYQTNPPGQQLQAQMCVAQQSAPTAGGITSVWMIDIGDGWTLGR